MLYDLRYYSIHELVPPELYRAYGDRAMYMFDINALITIDLLRSHYGSCTINNWFWGGDYKNSGFRLWNCPEGARLSQHKFGRAFDCKFKNVSADEVREDMRKSGCFESKPKQDIPFRFHKIRRIEAFEGMSWFHFDVAPVVLSSGILVIGDTNEKSWGTTTNQGN